MPRATFKDGTITISSNRKYPHMLVELLDKNGEGQGYVGAGSKVEHYTGQIEAINVNWDPSGHIPPVQTLEIAEDVDFDPGMDVALKMDVNE
ncbi:hypothetical protein N7540_003614 [Penicillium herquei]|nr:hypothetical protein N7540_003614 [Penicillium herquei]